MGDNKIVKLCPAFPFGVKFGIPSFAFNNELKCGEKLYNLNALTTAGIAGGNNDGRNEIDSPAIIAIGNNPCHYIHQYQIK